MVHKYIKRPIAIEAIQFTRANWDEVVEFTKGAAINLTIEKCINGKATCIIPTLEGDHIASEFDYIIKGVRGEFYPCKRDIFLETYELAD